jgi:CDP-paratose 2-epimerase
MRYLITGGCGFIGANLASALLAAGEQVTVFDNLFRTSASENLSWLRGLAEFRFIHGDVRLAGDVDRAVVESEPDVVFHLAGQVAMTTSIANPRLDFETNVIGGFNVLEAVRRIRPGALVTYSSTNKVYGELAHIAYEETPTRYVAPAYPDGFDETLPLDFRSPYGCSKGAVDQYMLDYARVLGVSTVVFRHSSVFGDRQFGTYDQGWIGWFIQQALRRQAGSQNPITISGTGKQVRDILFVDDLITCYLAAVHHRDRCSGEAFNIGGGPHNSLSLLELFDFLECELGVDLAHTQLPWRPSDQRVYVSNSTKAARLLGWSPRIGREDGLRRMIDWARANV